MTDFRYFRDFGLAINDDGTHVVKIDRTCFVVDGDTVQEVGTDLHYDPVTDMSFQLLADGRRVSALFYEAFGTYPRCLEIHSRWLRRAYRAAKFFMSCHGMIAPWSLGVPLTSSCGSSETRRLGGLSISMFPRIRRSNHEAL